MIKTAIVTIAGAGLIGTGVQSLTPQDIELNAGTLKLTFDADGFKTKMNAKPEFATKIRLKSGRIISVHF